MYGDNYWILGDDHIWSGKQLKYIPMESRLYQSLSPNEIGLADEKRLFDALNLHRVFIGKLTISKELQEAFNNATQNHLDNFAKERNYGSCIEKYLFNYTPKFKNDIEYCNLNLG